MANPSVKIDRDLYNSVIEHTQKNGSKIGKFFEIAAKEKMERDAEKENVVLQRYSNKFEHK